MMNAEAARFLELRPGDPFPWLTQKTTSSSNFSLANVAGHYLVFCFYGKMTTPIAQLAMKSIAENRSMFDDKKLMFFGVSIDPVELQQANIADSDPGIRFLLDYDLAVSRHCGAAPMDEPQDASTKTYRPFWLIVDPTLHVMAKLPMTVDPNSHSRVIEFLKKLPAPGDYAGFEIPAPVLILPNVFEAALCNHLIGLYESAGGVDTGVHRDGKEVHDYAFKRRKDFFLTDERLITQLQNVMLRKVIPEIAKFYFMKITRMERYLVGCYAAEDNAHFRPHRDNDQPLSAHRRFAVSINLNQDFDGGEVSFPEFNRRGIKAPTGWAIVFPAPILHQVSAVTRGRRYAFLPFVYDEAGAVIRERNLKAEAERSS